MILYTKMKSSVRRMKPVFHTQMDLSMAEMPRNTKTMVSDPLAKTFMTYLTVVTDLSSMFALMYFWQHIPQKTILQDKNTHFFCLNPFLNVVKSTQKTSQINEIFFFTEYSRKDGREWEHLSRQVGEVSQDEDEARLDDLDVFSASGHKRDEQTKHEAHEGATERHHEEGNWRRRKRKHAQIVTFMLFILYFIILNEHGK